MKKEKLMDSIGMLDEETIASADLPRKKLGKYVLRWAAAAACLCFIIAVVAMPLLKGNAAVCLAEYPQSIPYPMEDDFIGEDGQIDYEAFSEEYDKWAKSLEAMYELPREHLDSANAFFQNTLKEFLMDDTGGNRVYSPLNIYMALSMLTELTDNQTRAQILNLLGQGDLQSVAVCAKALWDANYINDTATSCILANSLWLSDSINYRKGTLNRLSENYFASAFCGEMGSAEYDKALRLWLNEQTKGLLEDSAEEVSLSRDTVLALASTVYYSAKWANEFIKEETAPEEFTTPKGVISCEFMKESRQNTVYYGEKFSALAKSLNMGGRMWLILPDEGVEINELLSDDSLFKLTAESAKWDNSLTTKVNLAMPKFDVSSNLDIREALKALGITDAFDSDISDFSPISEEIQEMALDKAEHAARVSVDEEGCIAAAYTILSIENTGMPIESEEIDFILNRPFIFVITSINGSPLFAGTVNQPK